VLASGVGEIIDNRMRCVFTYDVFSPQAFWQMKYSNNHLSHLEKCKSVMSIILSVEGKEKNKRATEMCHFGGERFTRSEK